MQAKVFPQKSMDWSTHLECEEEVDVLNDPHLPFTSGERCRAHRKPVLVWIASGFCSHSCSCSMLTARSVFEVESGFTAGLWTWNLGHFYLRHVP